MLFKQIHLEGIAEGRISLAFRRWTKAAVNTGSLLKTSVGLIEVLDISAVSEKSITREQALQAGFTGAEQLLGSLRMSPEGRIYKITLRYYASDPRIALRENTNLTAAELKVLEARLEKLDRFSTKGRWTTAVLSAIQKNPFKRASEIAQLTGFEKDWLKINIRKLKNLGLTISHLEGYELSPRGIVLFKNIGIKSEAYNK